MWLTEGESSRLLTGFYLIIPHGRLLHLTLFLYADSDYKVNQFLLVDLFYIGPIISVARVGRYGCMGQGSRITSEAMILHGGIGVTGKINGEEEIKNESSSRSGYFKRGKLSSSILR